MKNIPFALVLLFLGFTAINAQQCVQLDVDNLPNPLALPPAACSGVPVSLCLPVCSPPNVADIVVSFTIDNPNVMATETISIDANGDLCIEVIATNNTCDLQTANLTINSITCASGDAVEGCVTACLVCLDAGAFFPTTLDPIDIYPEPYTVVDIPPACDGVTAGQYSLTAADGTVCHDIIGTAGTMACPGTNAVLQTGVLEDFSPFGCAGPFEANYDINCDDCSCPAPTATAVAGATNDVIDISITNGGGNGLYDIEWGPVGFIPGTGTETGSINGTFNTFESVAGLNCSSTFDIYVRDNCAMPVPTPSDWVGILGVMTTACPGQGCTDPILLNLTCNCTTVTNMLMFPFGTGTGIEDPCGMGTNNNEAVWYEFIPPVNGILDVSSTNDPATPDTDVSILSGACGATVCEGFDDDGGAGFSSQVVGIPVLAGVSYYVEWGDDWDTAPGDWEINFAPDPPNPALGTAGTDTYDFTYDMAPCPTMTYEFGLPGFAQGAGLGSGSATTGTVGLTGLTPGTNYDICFYCDVLGCGDDATTVVSCDFSNADAAAGLAAPVLNCLSFTTNTSCPSPMALTCDEDVLIPGNMDVTWQNGGGSGLYDLEFGPTGFAPGTGTELGAINGTFDTFTTLTGLTCGDTFDVYVRDNCTGPPTASSIWFGPCTTTLFCPPPPPMGVDCSGDPNADPFVVFAEEFDVVGGWTINPAPAGDGIIFPFTGATGSAGTGPNGAASGANYVYYEATGGVAGDVNTLTSPPISLGTSIIDAELSFFVHMFDNGTGNMGDLSVEVSNDGGVTFTQVNFITGQQQINQTDPFFQVGADLSAFLGQTIQIQLVFTRGGGFQSDIAIDLLEITTCVDNGSCVLQSPGLTVSPCDDAGTTSDITDDTYTFDLDPQGVGTSTYTVFDAATNAILGSAVAYGAPTTFGPFPADAIVTSIFLVDDADDMCSLTFDVAAPSPCSPNPAPPEGVDCSSDPNTTPFVIWFDDFEDPTIMNWTGDVDTDMNGIETGGDWIVPHPDSDLATGGTGPDFAQSGTNFAFYESSTNSGQAFMTSVPINLSSALIDAELTFWVHMFGLPEDMGDLEAQVSNDGGATWTTISLASGLQQAAATDPWIQAGADLSPFIGQTIQIRFVATPLATINGDIAVDNVEITTCFNNAVCILQASGLNVNACDDGGTPSDISDDTFTFDLDPTGAGLSTYTVTDAAGTIIGAAGNTYGAPTMFGPFPSNGSVLNLTITDDADPNCFFLVDVTVPAPCSPAPPPAGMVDCSADPNSAPFVLFSEDFEAAPGWTGDIVTAGSGWFEFDTGGTTSTTTGPAVAHSGTGYAYYEATGGTAGNNSVFITPPISLGTALIDAELTFWLHMWDNGTGNMGDLQAQVSNDGGMTFTTIVLASGAQQILQGDAYIQTGADLSAFLGQTIQIQFVATNGANFESDIAIDLVEITTCVSSTTCVMQSTELMVSECNFNGTASDTSDDTFTFDLDPMGVGFSTYTVIDATGAVIGTAGNAYGAPTTFGPFPAGGGDLMLSVSDDADPNCFLDFIVTDPGDCSPFAVQTVGTCADFDAGIPTWMVQSTMDDFDYTLSAGGTTPSIGTGPQNGDNTTGTGEFIFIETSGGNAGDVASITGAWDLTGATNPSLQFYYDMLGAQIGTLNVFVDDGTGPVNVFSISGDQGGGWTLVPVSLSAYLGQTVLITFEAVHNGSFAGDIALDDICVLDANNCAILTGGLMVLPCDFSGTPTDPTDDLFSITLDPQGTLLAGTYTVTDATGAVMGTGGNPYGAPTMFGTFPAGGGDFVLTITDDTDPACTIDVTITDPGACSDITALFCSDGSFTDSGGAAVGGLYQPNENTEYLICPDSGVPGDVVELTFNFVDIETAGANGGSGNGCWDFLSFFDGNTSNSPLIGEYCGEESGDGGVTGGPAMQLAVGTVFTSTDPSGCLFITFQSDGSVQEEGWEATIACVQAGVCTVNAGSDATIDLCNTGFSVPIDITPTDGDPGGTFTPALTLGGGQFDLNIDPPGVYTYTVVDPNDPTCMDTADITVNVTTAPTCNTDCTMGDLEILDVATCSCVVDIVTISGCTDMTACNFDASANCDDGSCDLGNAACADPCNPSMGCTDPTACNFDPAACLDDGSCSAPPCNPGCTDPCASNFDPAADSDDGSCNPVDTTCNTDCTMGDLEVYDFTLCSCVVDVVTVNGCTDIAACNFDVAANCDDGSCDLPNGCTDPAFCEFDPSATCGDPAACITSNADPGTCNTDCTLGDIEIWDPVTCSCVVDIVTISGCTDPVASNFDPAANCDDGSCMSIVFQIDGGNAGGPFMSDDPCACNNDESAPNAGDGTFSELVIVTGPPGLNVIASGMSTGLIGVLLPAPFVETAPGNYELTFNHLNLVGFTITVGVEDPANPGSFIPALDVNGNQVVQSNVCAYPVLTSSLPTMICNNAGPQDLDMFISEDNGDPPGTTTYTIDGAAAGNMLDPSAFAIGQTLTIVATFTSTDDGNGGSSPDGTEPAHPGMCDQTFTASVTIQDCASCPTTSTVDCPEDLCDGDTPTTFAVVVDDPLGTGISSGWFADAAGTIPLGPVSNQGCASSSGSTFYVVSCDSDADGVADTQVVLLTHNFNIYPADFTATVTNTTDCSAPSVSIAAADGTECATDSGVGAAAPICPETSSSESSFYEFTFFDGTSCEQFFSGLITSDCTGTCPCPTPLVPVAASVEDACGTSTPNLPSDAQIVDDPTLGTIVWSPDPTIPVVSGCAPIVVVYTPNITCTNDCSMNTVGATHTLTVFPDPADYAGAVAVDGACGSSPTLDLSGVTCLPDISGPNAIVPTVDGCATDLDTANDPVDGSFEFVLTQPAATVAACAPAYSETLAAADVACTDTCPGIVDFCELVIACVDVSECDGTSGAGLYTASITVAYNLSSGQTIDVSIDGTSSQSVSVTNGVLTSTVVVVNGLSADNLAHTIDATVVDSNGICTTSAMQVSFNAPEDCTACNVTNPGTVTGP